MIDSGLTESDEDCQNGRNAVPPQLTVERRTAVGPRPQRAAKGDVRTESDSILGHRAAAAQGRAAVQQLLAAPALSTHHHLLWSFLLTNHKMQGHLASNEGFCFPLKSSARSFAR